MLPALTNMLNAKNEIERRMLIFFMDGLNHCNESIRFYFYNCLSNGESTMYRNIRDLAILNNISLSNLPNLSKTLITVIYKNKVISNWRTNMIKEILKILNGDFTVNNFDTWFIKDILNFLCTF